MGGVTKPVTNAITNKNKFVMNLFCYDIIFSQGYLSQNNIAVTKPFSSLL